MVQLVFLDPVRCRMWDLHDRLDHYVDEAICRAEIESFRKHGQLVPVSHRVSRWVPRDALLPGLAGKAESGPAHQTAAIVHQAYTFT